MMKLEIKKTDNGIRIGEHFIYAPQTVVSWIINLHPIIGAEMAYDRGGLLSIDFPGEYDISGTIISVFAGNGEKLNYLISHETGKFWIIQSPEVLEMDEVNGMDIRIFSDDSISKKLDQLEIEGERIDINQLSLAE